MRLRGVLRFCAFAFLLLATSKAFALYHLFRIDQLYTNASGTVQFIVMHEYSDVDGENQWLGKLLKTTGPGGGGEQRFFFPGGLPYAATSGRSVLIGTQGFAALGIVTPDYVVPNGFLPVGGGTLTFADADQISYAALPTDGIHSIDRNGVVQTNLATNFLGQSASVGGAPAAFTPLPGVWWNKSEAGSGLGIDYKDGTLIVEVYSYLGDGSSQWYLAAGALANNVFTATLDKYTGGQCISCGYKAPAIVGNDGTITLTFTSATTGTADLPGGRHIAIERYFAAQPNVQPAAGFAPVPGVWWNKDEAGSGLGIDYQDGTLIVEVYSYLAGGASQWYLAAGALANNLFTATLDKYTGGQCISCAYKSPAVSGNDGMIAITFTSTTTATADLPGGRHIQLQRFFQ